MKKFLVFVSFLVLMTTVTDTSPILSEKDAKQILRTRREDRPRKAGFPDEPMRYILHCRQRGDGGVSGQCGDRGVHALPPALGAEIRRTIPRALVESSLPPTLQQGSGASNLMGLPTLQLFSSWVHGFTRDCEGGQDYSCIGYTLSAAQCNPHGTAELPALNASICYRPPCVSTSNDCTHE